MSGITPKAQNHANLPPLASRFVDVAALPWEKTSFPGVEAKTLLIDRATGLLTVLLKMGPGVKLPDHEHVLIEQTYLLAGTLVCGEGTVGPGKRHGKTRRQHGLRAPESWQEHQHGYPGIAQLGGA